MSKKSCSLTNILTLHSKDSGLFGDSQEMTVGCVYSPPNGTSVEWLQNAGQFVDGVSQLLCFRLRVSCKRFTCNVKYYTKA